MWLLNLYFTNHYALNVSDLFQNFDSPIILKCSLFLLGLIKKYMNSSNAGTKYVRTGWKGGGGIS